MNNLSHNRKLHPILPDMFGLLLLFFFIFNFNPIFSHSSSPDRYSKSVTSTSTALHRHQSQEYIELSRPLSSDHLTPSCSHLVLNHSFANTMGSPPTSVPYSPPSDCPFPWLHVILDLRVTCHGDQYDRISGLWLGGAELLRTSTAEPTTAGTFWKVRKEITKYSSLLARSDLNFTMMLENLVNDVFTGVYDVNVTFFYYNATVVNDSSIAFSDLHQSHILDGKLGLEESSGRGNIGGSGPFDVYGKVPADLIIPISESNGTDKGFWFRIESESDIHSKEIQIPANAIRLILELYISFHGNDEFWYMNFPNSYISENNLTTGRGNGAYREVYVTLDGEYLTSVVPFPVIFTGGINPLFWEPVVAIGAFNLPSYEINFTPFLEKMLDNKTHSFTIGVADGISFWLVDANLHIWVSTNKSMEVQARSVPYRTPTKFQKRVKTKFKKLDGQFQVQAKRQSQYIGWVKSKEGNLTTRVIESFKFKNTIRLQKNATVKSVKQNIKMKREVRLEDEMGAVLDRKILKGKYPLNIITVTTNLTKQNEYSVITNLSHALNLEISDGIITNTVDNSQDSSGWMLVRDHDVLAGEAATNHSFSYQDDSGCYSRTVAAKNGWLVSDNSTFSCPASS